VKCHCNSEAQVRVNVVNELSSPCRLQAARQVEFMVGKEPAGPNTDSLEEAVAILQHHDGVSCALIP
jgi:hypothetical protein